MTVTSLMRWLGGALALVAGISPTWGQEPPAHGPKKIYTHSTVFRLPVQIDDRERAGLKELKLYVKAVPGEWACQETAPPAQTSFSFRAPHDGEYWFAFITVDKAGRCVPAHPDAEPPGLIVVVDTVAPDIEVLPLPASNQVYLQCKLHDANPDYRTVKVEYEAMARGTLGWIALEPVPDTPGVFMVPDRNILYGKLQVHAADKAGNRVDKIVELAVNTPKVPATDKGEAGSERMIEAAVVKSPESVTTPPAMVVPPAATVTPATVAPIVDVPSVPGPMAAPVRDNQPPASLPRPAATSADQLPAIPDPVAASSVPAPISTVLMPDSLAAPVSKPATGEKTGSDRSSLPPGPASTPEAVPVPAAAVVQEPAPSRPPLLPRDLTLVNSHRCKIDFSVDGVEGSVTKVELWATMDGGKSWQMIGESGDGKSPVQVEFPQDGVYGYSFVVRQAIGAPVSPPNAGDLPDAWIEVDTLKPVAELKGATVGTGADAGCLLITWLAQDKNFGPEPIALFYALQPSGPWYPIADRIANTGSHRWPMPKGLNGRVHIRLQAADRAGNIAICDTPSSISLEARPKVKVLNVAPAEKN
jgi:hypothetical protein